MFWVKSDGGADSRDEPESKYIFRSRTNKTLSGFDIGQGKSHHG